MDYYFKKLENLLNSGDPEVRTWFLVRCNTLPFIISLIYILFSKRIGPALMKNRKPFELKTPMIIYNFSLVVTYIYWFIILFLYAPKITFDQICHEIVVKKGDVTYTLARACWVIYLVKYAELFDTVFFVLRKKMSHVTFLHVIHHALMPIYSWIVMRTENNGMQVIPAIINSFIHVIMYSYYGLSAMGPEVRKRLWWKKYLTQLQMAQFLLVIIFITVVAPLTGCKMVISTCVIQIILALLFFYLFYNFYKASFLSKRKSSEASKLKTKDFSRRGIQESKPQYYETKNSEKTFTLSETLKFSGRKFSGKNGVENLQNHCFLA